MPFNKYSFKHTLFTACSSVTRLPCLLHAVLSQDQTAHLFDQKNTAPAYKSVTWWCFRLFKWSTHLIYYSPDSLLRSRHITARTRSDSLKWGHCAVGPHLAVNDYTRWEDCAGLKCLFREGLLQTTSTGLRNPSFNHCLFSYAIGSWKLSTNEQFFCFLFVFVGAQTVVSLLQTNKTRHVIYSCQQSLHQHK